MDLCFGRQDRYGSRLDGQTLEAAFTAGLFVILMVGDVGAAAFSNC